MSYKVEADFNYKGYRCVIVLQSGGHRCGYVGLPQNHPLYGLDYQDPLNASFDDMEDTSLGKRSPMVLLLTPKNSQENVSMDIYFDIHGGVTYSGGGKGSKYPVESDLWWIGFDCIHYCDAKDIEAISKEWPDDPQVKQTIEWNKKWEDGNGIVRTKEYVWSECTSLVDQIIDLVKKHYNASKTSYTELNRLHKLIKSNNVFFQLLQSISKAVMADEDKIIIYTTPEEFDVKLSDAINGLLSFGYTVNTEVTKDKHKIIISW